MRVGEATNPGPTMGEYGGPGGIPGGQHSHLKHLLHDVPTCMRNSRAYPYSKEGSREGWSSETTGNRGPADGGRGSPKLVGGNDFPKTVEEVEAVQSF